MPTSGAELGPTHASKACHNCRRRRLRCDRRLPHCAKCASSGVHCAGYGRLFLWTGAVASRGRLAGKDSSAFSYPERERAPVQLGPSVLANDHQSVTGLTAGQSTTIGNPSHNSAAGRGTGGRVQQLQRVGPAYASPWGLVDPLLQDLSHSHRRYLDYFSSHLCREFVSFDHESVALPGQDRNPFRRLIQLTRAHPLLRHVVVAASATHMFNRARPWLDDHSLERGEGPRDVLIDALVAKDKMLRMMPHALQNINPVVGEIILAGVLFLMNVELIESGKHDWKAHLDGAGRIMALLGPVSAVDDRLRDYLMSDCFTYYILDSTFRPAAPGSQPFFDSSRAVEIFERTGNHYYCCPPELLGILLEASRLSGGGTEAGDAILSGEMMAAAGAALLRRARNVDVAAWAREHPRRSGVAGPLDHFHVSSRLRAASAHRLGICLYILHAVPSLEDLVGGDLADELMDELHATLCAITGDDPNFKATTWVTFILGASARSTEMKEWVTRRLRRLAMEIPWGFLSAAGHALTALWRLDSGGPQNKRKSWVQISRELNSDLLVV